MLTRTSWRWLLSGLVALVASGCGSAPRSPGAEQAFRARAEALESLQVVGVIGASTSGGFGSGISLGSILKAGLAFPHRLVERPDVMFFADPRGNGRAQIEFLEAQGATAVVALDYLFWFAYGSGSRESRLRELEHGLELLDDLSVDLLLVGDLPDMSGASKLFLPPHAIPPPDQLSLLNDRLREWAGERSHVRVIPLATTVLAMRSGTPLTIGAESIAVRPSEVLLNDRLHPNRRGQLLLARLILTELATTYPALASTDLITDGPTLERELATRNGAPTASRGG